MKIINVDYQTNCYLVCNEETKGAFVVDCIYAPFVIKAAEKEGVKIKDENKKSTDNQQILLPPVTS